MTAARIDGDSPKTQPESVTRWEWILLASVLALIVITRLSTLDQLLMETGPAAFRQTQTAFQTVEFHRLGIDLLHPSLPILGSPWSIPFEFPLFQAAASVLMSWGFESDVANRITGLFFFATTATLLWYLIRLVADKTVAAISLVVFAFSPFGILWSRTAMMEYLATAAALSWVIAALKWRTTRRWQWAAFGAVAGSVAMTVKITTALPWLAPILLFNLKTEKGVRFLSRAWARVRTHPAFLALVLIPGIAGLLWTRHADSIKGASEATSWLTSSALRSWNLGTIGQRLDGDNFSLILGRIESLITGRGWLILAFIALLILRRHRAFWLGILLVPVLAIGTFYNLYVEHEYYLVAVSPALAALLAVGIRQLALWFRPRRASSTAVIAIITVAWLGVGLWSTKSHWVVAYEEPGIDAASVEIAALSAPSELVIVVEGDWNPRFLYNARRRGMMVRPPFVTMDVVASQPDLSDYALFYSLNRWSGLIDFASVRPWFAPASANALRLGDSRSELGTVQAVASTGPVPTTLEAGAHRLILERSSIACDDADAISIPAGTGIAWLRIAPEGTARAVMGPNLMPVPSQAQTLIWAPPPGEDQRPEHTLTCLGGGLLEVTESGTVSDS